MRLNLLHKKVQYVSIDLYKENDLRAMLPSNQKGDSKPQKVTKPTQALQKKSKKLVVERVFSKEKEASKNMIPAVIDAV